MSDPLLHFVEGTTRIRHALQAISQDNPYDEISITLPWPLYYAMFHYLRDLNPMQMFCSREQGGGTPVEFRYMNIRYVPAKPQ